MDTLFLVLLAMATFIPCILGGCVILAIKRQHRLNMFLRLAQTGSRYLVKGSNFLASNPSVLFVHGSRRIQLSLEDCAYGPAVLCSVSMADMLPKDIRLSIYSRQWSSQSYGEIPFADMSEMPETSDKLSFRTTDDDVLLGLMTAKSCMHVLQLLQLFNNKNILINYTGTHLVVMKYCAIDDERKLRLFYETFVAFVNSFIDALGRRGLPMGEEEATALPSSHRPQLPQYTESATEEEFQVIGSETDTELHCQICGAAIQEDHVRCSACDTPYHEDCWHYYGKCATFGCPSTKHHEVSYDG